MKKEIKKLKEQAKQLLSRIEELEAKEIDYSILNDEDVFYLKSYGGFEFLFKGSNFFYEKVKGYNFNEDYIFEGIICNKKDIADLRKATKEEHELYYKHYPRTIDVWIMLNKSKYGGIITYSYESEKEAESERSEYTIKIQKVTIPL